MRKNKVIFDVETTGLDFMQDEILQFSAINEYGEVLMDTYIKPTFHTSWIAAENINHISPEMVMNCKTFEELKDDIQAIFDNASELIANNASFDISFLKASGIMFPDCPISDPMIDFAKIKGEWNDYYENYKWQKLSTAAYYYGYNFDNLAHNSLEDVKATLIVYISINQKRPPYLWISTQLRDEDGIVIFESSYIESVLTKCKELYGKIQHDRIFRVKSNGLSFDDFVKKNTLSD